MKNEKITWKNERLILIEKGIEREPKLECCKEIKEWPKRVFR